jgi:hypothetical protein
VLLATPGRHPFFTEEASVIRDARRVPIEFGGYSLSFRGGHAQLQRGLDLTGAHCTPALRAASGSIFFNASPAAS